MSRLYVSLAVAALMLSACAPDTRMPESSYQWQQRQDRIEQDWRASQTAPQTTPAPKDKP
ncbi:MAG: hypothetical protein AB1448_08245 [Pseudomonadota bacterium]